MGINDAQFFGEFGKHHIYSDKRVCKEFLSGVKLMLFKKKVNLKSASKNCNKTIPFHIKTMNDNPGS